MTQPGGGDSGGESMPPPPSASASSAAAAPAFRPRPLVSSSQRSASASSTAANAGVSTRISGGDTNDGGSSGAGISGAPFFGVRHHQHAALAPNVTTTPSGLAYVRSPVLGGSRSEHRKRPLPRLPPQNAAGRDDAVGQQQHLQNIRVHVSLRSQVQQPSPMGMESPAGAAATAIMRASTETSNANGTSMEDGIPPPPSLFASTGPRRRGRGGVGSRAQGMGVGTSSSSDAMYLRSSVPIDHHAEDTPILRSASCDGSVASSSACSSTIPPLIGERRHLVANGASIWQSSREEQDAAIGSAEASANADTAHRRIAGASSFDSLAATTGDLLRTTGQVAAGAWTKGSPHIARLGSAATTMISRTLSREEDYDDLAAPTHSPRRGIAEAGSRLGNATGTMISRTLSREEDFGDLKSRIASPPRRALGGVRGRLGQTAASVISRTLSREDDYEYDMQLPRRGKGLEVDTSQIVADDHHFSSIVLHRWDDCILVRAEGGRPGSLILTSTHLIFEFDEADDEPDYLSSRHRFISESDYLQGFAEESRKDADFAFRPNVPKMRRGSNDSTDSFAGALSQPPTPSSSTGGTSNTKSSTLDEGDKFDDSDSYCSEAYQEDMSKTLIRAVEEEARRRLQELDDGGEGDATSTVGSVASSTASLFFARRPAPGQWASGSARVLLDDESDVSGFDEDRLMAWRRQALATEKKRPVEEPNRGATKGVKEDSDQDQQMLDTHTLAPERARRESQYRGLKWRLSSLDEIYSRAFMMRDVAFEIFAKTAENAHSSNDGCVPIGNLSDQSFYIAVPPMRHATLRQSSRRDEVVGRLKRPDQARGLSFAFWHTSFSENENVGRGRWKKLLRGQSSSSSGIDSRALESLYALTRAWRRGDVSNFVYLSRLNAIAGRSFHDPSSYPVFPWVLCNYTSDTVPDLSCESNYRDLSKPMGALLPERLEKFMGKYQSLCNSIDSPIPAFMYGSHYSCTGGVPLHFLVRKRPFAGLHRQLQGGGFDLPDRLFRSVAMTYDLCSRTSSTDVKELTPEFYSDPSFLVNFNGFDLGICASGEAVDDVILPPWANGSPEKFVKVMRDALESNICSKMLPSWIDLIFGISSRGSEARTAHNIFYHLTYIEPGDLEKIADEELRTETELHIADFGRCCRQLFHQPHPRKRGLVG